jgi:hypothetical protein
MELLGSIVISAIISSIISVIISNKKNKLKYITNERKQWREEIREISKQIFILFNENESLTNQQKHEIEVLRLKLKLRLNPDDDYDLDIINSITELKKDFSSLKLYNFEKKISRLLKHDWERSKLETKIWFIRFFEKRNLQEIRKISE